MKRSTLSDANTLRRHEVFTGLFAEMVRRASRGLRRKVGESLYLIDSTSVRLNALSADWARFSSTASGAKAHVIYDAEAERPVYHHVTASRVNDITAAKVMPIEPGATYVFDLGYYDYRWWAELDAAGCRFVTRLRKSTSLTVTAELDIASEDEGHILSDRIGLLPARQGANRKNPFSDPVREVCVKAENGTVLRIICNDLDASAREIADLYKRRWAIELFFRWIKQTLKIKHFYGTSENAVRIQIAVALIVYLLLQAAHKTQTAVKSLYQFAQLVRVNLMLLKPIDKLLLPEKRRFHSNHQMELTWA